MGLLDEQVTVPRRTMTLFFVIDTSGSMIGKRFADVRRNIGNKPGC